MGALSVYNVVFIVGLALSVRVMVVGVERELPAGVIEIRTRWAMLAGAFTLAGFLGSLLRHEGVSATMTAVLAALGLVAGVVSARVLVQRAVAMPVTDHEFDPRFELQGTPAVVVEAIPAAGEGLVRLPDGSTRGGPLRARSIDGVAIERGVEVAVERIDDDVAFVEAWSVVEARL